MYSLYNLSIFFSAFSSELGEQTGSRLLPGRRSKRSCISASHWPQASVSQLLQQCGEPTHITTWFHYTVTPTVRSTNAHRNGVSPYSPPLSFKEPLRLILTYREHMKIPTPGLGIISIQRYLKQLPKLEESKTKDLKYYLNIQTGP